MNLRTVRWVTGLLGLAALSALYCMPWHASAKAPWWDVGSHVLLFLAIGLWFGTLARRRWRVLAALAAIGLVLELVQRWLGHFARVEWLDVASNEAGLALAWGILTGARLAPWSKRS